MESALCYVITYLLDVVSRTHLDPFQIEHEVNVGVEGLAGYLDLTICVSHLNIRDPSHYLRD